MYTVRIHASTHARTQGAHGLAEVEHQEVRSLLPPLVPQVIQRETEEGPDGVILQALVGGAEGLLLLVVVVVMWRV